MINNRPENRVYRYNFFFDNCATRPAAIIENQTNGKIDYDAPFKQQTFRDLINYCTRNKPWLTFGCDLALGSPTDRIATPHEMMFLPPYLKEAFGTATITGADGSRKKLVSSTKTLVNGLADEERPDTGFFTPLVSCWAFFLVVLASIVLGCAIPAGVLWLLAVSDTKVRSRKDVEGVLSVPFLGEIPMRDKKDKSEVVVHENGRDSVSEAFRIVRTNMDFMRVKDKKMQVVMFTSFNPGAGKTFVSMNLAMSFALTHKKVVLVDLDIRKGTLSSHVHVSDKGVTNYLSGRIDNVDEIIRQNELCDKLDIIHAGPVPPNPAELLLGDRLETLIAELRKRYDYIILDNVPAGVVADAVIVNRVADLTIYVVRAGRMDRRALPEVEKLYQEGKLRNMSLILNGTVYKHGAYGYRYGYGYGYSYGYGYGYGQHKK